VTDAHTYALHLATTLRDKHFPGSSFTPAPDTLGLLMQIDNMTSMLVLAETNVYDRIERRLDRLYSKLVTEPHQRQEAAIAAHKAEMEKANRLNDVFKGADPALIKTIHTAGGLDCTLAEGLLTQADPGAVLAYLYQGPGKTRRAEIAKLPAEDMQRELDAISRRITVVKGVMSRALGAVYPVPKNKANGQGTEDK
jgi:hypothetical protein